MTRRPRDVRRMAGLLAVVAAGVACSPPRAEEEPEPAPLPDAPVESGRPAAARVSADEVRDAFFGLGTSRLRDAGNDAFLDAFADSDWASFGEDGDEHLLQCGAFWLARRAIDRGDAATAGRATEFLAARFPEVGSQVLRTLPAAHALRGDFAAAEAVASRFTTVPDAGTAGWAHVYVGDVRLAQGDAEGARAAWKAAAKVPAPDEAGGSLLLAQEAAGHRLRSVGRTVPSLEVEGGGPSEWIVGGPFAADALRGRVAVVLPFETNCGPCRDMLSGLQRLHDDRADAGLLVIGLLRPQPEGRLPPPGARDLWSGADRVEIPPDGMRDHAVAFARNAGLTFPLGLVSVRTWSRWALLGSHPVLVVGPEGRVEFLTAGGDTLGLVRVTADRLLAAQRK